VFKKILNSKSFIIRGIGYQASLLENSELNYINKEFKYTKYLVLRVGHSIHKYYPIPNNINVLIKHKNRKVVIYGFNKTLVSDYSKYIYLMRSPNVYTGRGIRIKKGNHRRKVGKKDGKKGKL
jgi:ribosomal protein L6P/L9E